MRQRSENVNPRMTMIRRVILVFCKQALFPMMLFCSIGVGVLEASAGDTDKPVLLMGACGGPDHSACPAQTYCEYPEGSCGKDAAFGKCNGLPEICTMEFAPVCGCDNKTYGNTCTAKSKGVSIAHQGECESAPR